MKNGDIKIDLQSIKAAVGAAAKLLKKYVGVLLFLLFMAVYGYVIYQINTLSSPKIDENEVSSQAKKVSTPRIDSESAKKLESLKDNSVNVQTLFEEGRTNPFQE